MQSNPMGSKTEFIPLQLGNGKLVKIEASMLGGEENVSFKPFEIQSITDTIEGIAEAVLASLERAKPDKVAVELGLEVGVESGQLITLWVKGSSKANLKIILQWDKEKDTPA